MKGRKDGPARCEMQRVSVEWVSDDGFSMTVVATDQHTPQTIEVPAYLWTKYLTFRKEAANWGAYWKAQIKKAEFGGEE